MAKKIFNRITTVFLILLVLLVIFLFVVRLSGNSPSVFGFRVYRVYTGSMEPTLIIGDVILIKSVEPEDIHKDDIITFRSLSEETLGMEITHRVVVEPEYKNGRYYIQTQGDSPGAPLDPRITADRVVGKFVCKLALIDKLYNFFFTPYGLIIFIGLIIALFGYEMISLMVSYKTLDSIDIDEALKEPGLEDPADKDIAEDTEKAQSGEKEDK